MEKEFIPYEQALELKHLGFEYISTIFAYDQSGELYTRDGIPHDFNIRGLLSAPTFSQVFKWFSNVYNLFPEIYTTTIGGYVEFTFQIRDLYSEQYIYDNFVVNTGGYSGTFHTIEDTEISCINKLIEIVKNK